MVVSVFIEQPDTATAFRKAKHGYFIGVIVCRSRDHQLEHGECLVEHGHRADKRLGRVVVCAANAESPTVRKLRDDLGQIIEPLLRADDACFLCNDGRDAQHHIILSRRDGTLTTAENRLEIPRLRARAR